MSEMTEQEAYERFIEGMKKAIACCRQLAEAQKDRNYNKMAFGLEKLCERGATYYKGLQLSRAEALRIVAQREAAQNEKING